MYVEEALTNILLILLELNIITQIYIVRFIDFDLCFGSTASNLTENLSTTLTLGIGRPNRYGVAVDNNMAVRAETIIETRMLGRVYTPRSVPPLRRGRYRSIIICLGAHRGRDGVRERAESDLAAARAARPPEKRLSPGPGVRPWKEEKLAPEKLGSSRSRTIISLLVF